MSTETLASCAETRQTGAAKPSAANKTRFIMCEIRCPSRDSQTSRIANDHGALLSVDPEIVWGGLLPAGPQQKVSALDNFQASRKLGGSRINPQRGHQA
jgi:hypothetical protein